MKDDLDQNEDKELRFCPEVHDKKGHYIIKVPQGKAKSKW
jgi:hypothetical protein